MNALCHVAKLLPNEDLASDADAKAAEACVDFTPLEDSEREAAREYFLAASRGNFLLEVFKSVNATAGDDFHTELVSEAGHVSCFCSGKR